MWQKTTASGKSHDMRAVCKLSWMKNLKAKQASLLNENYNHAQFKKRLPNEGYTTLVRKFETSSSFSHGEEPNNCALAHCRCNNAAEDFDRNETQTLCQNYSRQDLSQDSLALKALAFRAVCVVCAFVWIPPLLIQMTSMAAVTRRHFPESTFVSRW